MNAPVLARTLEAQGLSTVLVTMMPYWAERVGVSRALAVEHPFGQTLGLPHDGGGQLRVIRQALDVLAGATAPGEIVHAQEIWPIPLKEAMRSWQPAEPSPIIAALAPDFRRLLRDHRRGEV